MHSQFGHIQYQSTWCTNTTPGPFQVLYPPLDSCLSHILGPSPREYMLIYSKLKITSNPYLSNQDLPIYPKITDNTTELEIRHLHPSTELHEVMKLSKQLAKSSKLVLDNYITLHPKFMYEPVDVLANYIRSPKDCIVVLGFGYHYISAITLDFTMQLEASGYKYLLDNPGPNDSSSLLDYYVRKRNYCISKSNWQFDLVPYDTNDTIIDPLVIEILILKLGLKEIYKLYCASYQFRQVINRLDIVNALVSKFMPSLGPTTICSYSDMFMTYCIFNGCCTYEYVSTDKKYLSELPQDEYIGDYEKHCTSIIDVKLQLQFDPECVRLALEACDIEALTYVDSKQLIDTVPSVELERSLCINNIELMEWLVEYCIRNTLYDDVVQVLVNSLLDGDCRLYDYIMASQSDHTKVSLFENMLLSTKMPIKVLVELVSISTMSFIQTKICNIHHNWLSGNFPDELLDGVLKTLNK